MENVFTDDKLDFVIISGDEGATAPQEEIEDLVIQLCELVNEKNDLFRKQTELMYMYVFLLLIILGITLIIWAQHIYIFLYIMH